tara:strand:+ start:1760 stop:1939 length:180 start_codon:yes stop_codon:yes gene_type:complete
LEKRGAFEKFIGDIVVQNGDCASKDELLGAFGEQFLKVRYILSSGSIQLGEIQFKLASL